jgi:hypothetical protein
VGDNAPVLDSIAKREQVLLGPLFAGVELRLFGHAIHPNSRALSLASFQAAVRKSARVIETRLSSFRGKQMLALTPPKHVTVYTSVAVAIIAVIIHYAKIDIPHVRTGFVTLLIGYLVLLAGNVFKGI